MLGAIAAWPYLSNRVDEEIRARVQAKFAAHYPQLTVSVRKAQLIKGRGIEVRGLTIADPKATGPRAELAAFDEIFLSCDTDLMKLATCEPYIQKIVIRRPVIRATRRMDGTWSAAQLLPLPKFSEHAAECITVENATLELHDPLKDPAGPFLLRDINLTLTPQSDEAAPGVPPDVRPMDVNGSLAADHVQRMEFSGLLDPRSKGWALGGNVTGLDLSPELKSALPTCFEEKCTLLDSLRGQAEVAFQLQFDPANPTPLSFDVTGQLIRGRLDDLRLPYPLTDIRGTVRANNDGVTIDGLEAHNNQMSIWLKARINGYTPTSPISLELQGRKVQLNRQVAEVLPPALRTVWEKFLPEGQVDANVKLAFDGQTWKPDLDVTCLDVAFTFYKFPYRLERGTGNLLMRDDRLELKLTAFGGGRPLRIDGQFEHPGPQFTGWAEVSGKGVPFDENLFAALPDKCPDVVRSMNPRGTFNFFIHSQRNNPNEPVNHDLTVDLNNCSLRYEKFPYPVANIQGQLVMHNKEFKFDDLHGTNDSGDIHCRGSMKPADEGGIELQLSFRGADVPLESELREALPPGPQRLWNDLRPRGTIDLTADVRFLSATKKLDVEIVADPHGETGSIEPTYFPYRLEKLKGRVRYYNGHADIESLHGTHGRVVVTTKGYGDQAADGRWHLHLEDLTVDRARFDPELLTALPQALKKVVAQLKPDRPVSLTGALDLAGRPGEPTLSHWDVKVYMESGSVSCGVTLENIHGGVRLVGDFDGQKGRSSGELEIQSLTYKDFQFNDVRGPLWIDEQKVLLGTLAQGEQARNSLASPGDSPRSITARLYNGTAVGNGQVNLGVTPQFTLRASLNEADLATFAQETLPGRQRLSGKVFADVTLRGSGLGVHTLSGEGEVHLTDANIYQLPVMLALLNVLSLRPPDTTAFTRSDIKFQIQGDHIYLKPIEFSGDVISLIGQGDMKLDTSIALVFYTVAGRTEWQIPILKNVLGQASQQMLQVHVDGTLAQPQARTVAFPGVNQAIQQLQADMQRPIDPPGPLPAGRSTLAPGGAPLR